MLDKEEEIYLTCKIIKHSRKNKCQKRYLLLTNLNFSIIKKAWIFSTIKRKIPFDKIFSLSISKHGAQVIIHCKNDYDFRFSSTEYREDIIDILRNLVQSMQILYIDDIDLK